MAIENLEAIIDLKRNQGTKNFLSLELNFFYKVSLRTKKLLFRYVNQNCTLTVILIDRLNPYIKKRIIPIWTSKHKIEPIKITRFKNELRFQFYYKGTIKTINFQLKTLLAGIYSLYFPIKQKGILIEGPGLQKVFENPIIKPSSKNRWESSAVFNSAAIYLEDKFHFVYRAVGESGLSIFGYASSDNGIQIQERASEPVFVCEKSLRPKGEAFTPYPYASGGSLWGCEDPRLTLIDETIYMTYTAFDGCHPPAVALTSIKLNDFLSKKWNWNKTKLISQAGVTNKNWVVFPEKIDGKFAVLHSISPQISIAYLDSLNFSNDSFIDSYYFSQGREAHWDNWVRGIGPPPIKTEEGWLILYHAMDKNDPDKYKLGAMILDEKQPEKILYRSNSPLLEPDQWYENNGHKKGVIYSCGAVLMGEKLFVYYGGSDKFICVATTTLQALMRQLTL